MRIAARRPPIPASTASTRPSATSCWPRATTWPDGQAHRRRSAGLHLDRRPLSRHGQARAASRRQPQFCDACFTGDYPIALTIRARRRRPPALPPRRAGLRPMRLRRGRVALVTGASRGLGAAAALAYANEGAHVVAVARTVGGLEELDDRIRRPAAAPRWSRSTSPTAPASTGWARRCYERFGKLDVLLGNAGMLGTLSPIGHIEPDDLREGHGGQRHRQWRLIRSLDPLLRAVGRRPRDLRHLGRLAPRSCPIGAPMPRARRRSTCWSGSTPPRCATHQRCGSISTIPAHAHRHAQGGLPRRESETLPPPEAHAEGLIQLALPSCTMERRVGGRGDRR